MCSLCSVIHDVDNYIESGKTMASLMIKKLFSCDWLHLPRNKYDPALDNYLISPLICQLLGLSQLENDFKDLTGVDTIVSLAKIIIKSNNVR